MFRYNQKLGRLQLVHIIRAPMLYDDTLQRKEDTRQKMIVALDIETEANDKREAKNALIPHLSHITCVGLWSPKFSKVFRGLDKLKEWLATNGHIRFVGHNFRFDLKHLSYHGVTIPMERWAEDTQLMAHICTHKVGTEWLEAYEVDRREANKKLPKGYSHRRSKGLSLKVLAPFFLGVPKFWENPADHDNDVYVLKDCEYTYKLMELFKKCMYKEGTYGFYHDWQLPISKMLLQAEIRGVMVDERLLDQMNFQSATNATISKKELDLLWDEGYREYRIKLMWEIGERYSQKAQIAISKAKSEEAKARAWVRYKRLLERNLETMDTTLNLNSPAQLLWLLRDHLGLDVKNLAGKESTGIEVLERLIQGGRDDIKTFMAYRKSEKLLKAFFPSYRKLLGPEDTLFCNFNTTGTRTGRLSSSEPNLQQVPGSLRKLFMARDGYKFITRDQSSIEPRLAAYFTEDENLCKTIMGGEDFHSRSAINMFRLACTMEEVKDRYAVERHISKTCGLALLYGAGVKRIYQTALSKGFKWSKSHCKEIYNRFKESYKEAFQWKEKLDHEALQGRPIINLFKRPHRYFDQDDIYMKTFNTLIQSSASDLVLDGALRAMKEFKEKGIDGHVLLFVHDEVVFEVREDQVEEAVDIIDVSMTDYALDTKWGRIPLKVEGTISDRWDKG